MTDWLSSALASVTVVLLVVFLGGPGWAAFGFGYLAFIMWRTRDKLK